MILILFWQQLHGFEEVNTHLGFLLNQLWGTSVKAWFFHICWQSTFADGEQNQIEFRNQISIVGPLHVIRQNSPHDDYRIHRVNYSMNLSYFQLYCKMFLENMTQNHLHKIDILWDIITKFILIPSSNILVNILILLFS